VRLDHIASGNVNANHSGAIWSKQGPIAFLRSCEHESISLASLGANIAQTNQQTSTDGVELMDSTPKTLKATLEAIRNMAANALNQIGQSQEEFSMRWKCKECRYIKHFTTPVSLERVGRCPRCKSTEFKLLCEGGIFSPCSRSRAVHQDCLPDLRLDWNRPPNLRFLRSRASDFRRRSNSDLSGRVRRT